MTARVAAIAPRRILQRKQAANFVSKSVPSCIGGWNARDSIADMDPRDAVSLINFVPTQTDCVVRGGFTKFATGFASQVETLPIYRSGTATKIFGMSGTNGYNITAGGAIGSAEVGLTSLTNARWQWVNVSTTGGSFLLMVNGSDKLRGYDGTNWWVDGDGTHDITGVDTAACIDIQVHNNRVWLVQKNTLLAWYLPLSSIAGAAVSFDFRSIFRRGGALIAMGTWTIDAGYGLNDHAVFVTNQGEVVVYIGLDPSSVSSWAKIGLYQIGSPIGNRPFVKWGGDLLLINYDGLTPLAQGLQSSRLDPRVNLTDKIRGAMGDATNLYGGNFGWQVFDFPKQSLLILNVPVQAGGAQEQYVMSTITKNWTKFQGWNANCWSLYSDDAYFGANTFVGKAYNGQNDANADITATGVQAFNYFGDTGITKRWTMMRPVFNTNGTPSALMGLNVDFNINTPTGTVTFTDPGYGLWDTALWDSGLWGGSVVVSQVWAGVNGVGKCAGATIKTVINGIDLHWIATTYVMETGWVDRKSVV